MYRVDVDAYAIENLVMSGVFPLATSVIDAAWSCSSILVKLDLTVALLSLSVVPFLFLCLRYYATTLSTQEERVKELESNLIRAAVRNVFVDPPREELRARAATRLRATPTPATTTMQARIAVTWQQSLFGVVGRRRSRSSAPRSCWSSAACTCCAAR